MKKYLILFIASLISFNLSAQCLGEDCSIKGRNQARKQKSAKMTGKRSGNGSLYSIGGGKKTKRKRSGSSQGFDPFASSGGKSSNAGGFDPFADYDKKNKKGKKGGAGYDPFASNDKKGKYKGRTSAGGYDPFDEKGNKKRGKAGAGGYDPFADNSKSRNKSKKSGGTWTASDGKRKLKVDYSSAYNDWDGSSKRGSARGRGRANDSWVAANSGTSAKVGKGGGIWADNSGGSYKGGKGKANDSWSNGSGRAGVQSGGGLWLDGGSPSKNKANKYENASNNWSNVDLASVTAAPRYERVDNTPKSYSDYENVGLTSDLIYDKPRQYKYNLIAGKIYQHEAEQKSYLTGASLRPVLGAEFCVEWPTVGSKNWHHYFNVPTTGLGFTYLNLGNEALLGSALAIYPYVDIPLLSTDPVDFNLTAGFGASYVTKWNKQSLSNNDSIPVAEITPMFGSPINVYIKGGFNLVIRPFTNISNQRQDALSHYSFSLGAYMTHLSNGNFASPNNGLNMFTAELGMKYCPSVLTPVVRASGEPLPKYFTLDIMGSAFMREMNRFDTKQYLVGNINLGLYFQAANIYRIGLGVDGFYDDAFADTHTAYPNAYANFFTTRMDPDKFEQRIRGGGCLSNEFVLGRVTAAIDGGYYFYDNIQPQYNYDYQFLNNTYFRFAMKYRFTNGLFGVVALKTHMLTAEYITFGLGYSILL